MNGNDTIRCARCGSDAHKTEDCCMHWSDLIHDLHTIRAQWSAWIAPQPSAEPVQSDTPDADRLLKQVFGEGGV